MYEYLVQNYGRNLIRIISADDKYKINCIVEMVDRRTRCNRKYYYENTNPILPDQITVGLQ